MLRNAMLFRLSVSTAAVALIAIPTVAHAQQRGVSLNIPAQDLGSALKAIAAATGQQVAFKGAAVRGKRSNAVQGTFTADEAVAVALRGSGLEVSRTKRGVIVVTAVEVKAASTFLASESAGDADEGQDIIVNRPGTAGGHLV